MILLGRVFSSDGDVFFDNKVNTKTNQFYQSLCSIWFDNLDPDFTVIENLRSILHILR